MERNAKEALDPLLHILDCRAKYEAGVYTRFYRSDPGCKVMLGMVMEETTDTTTTVVNMRAK